MAYLGPSPFPRAAGPAPLTAPVALSLAESAMKAGRIEAATRYINIAYAIFDASLSPQATNPSALRRTDD